MSYRDGQLLEVGPFEPNRTAGPALFIPPDRNSCWPAFTTSTPLDYDLLVREHEDMLSSRAIQELKETHRLETGECLTDEEAWSMARHLLRVFEVLFLPPVHPNDPVAGAQPVGFDNSAIVS